MFESKLNKGKPAGYAPLGANNKVPNIHIDLSSVVSATTTLTINGETHDLSTNRTWTITGGTGGQSGLSGTDGISGISGLAGVNSGTSLYWYAENATPPTTAPIASGSSSVAIGDGAEASSDYMFAVGTAAGVGTTGSQKANFIGYYAGNGATGAFNSNFIGVNAGQNATGADKSNFFGHHVGENATNALRSNFIGRYTGYYASGASYSNFLGNHAGYTATDATYSNFLGASAGNNATYANNSNFLGQLAGNNATSAEYSNFLGYNAGFGANSANNSNFFGKQAGQTATDADNSTFIGNHAGFVATYADYSNFLGYYAGFNATTANNSNFFGKDAGNNASYSFNSNFFGTSAGKSFPGNIVSSNNIIIGTNISLPDATANAINIGGVLFGTGTYSDISGYPSIVPNDGKIGINVVNPTNALHISASTDPIRIESLTANTLDTDVLSIDATGVIHRYPISGLSTSIIATNTQTTGYTLSLTDQNKLVEMSAATSITVTVPAYSAVNFNTGVQILLVRGGSGDVSVVADSGVTIKSVNNYLFLNNQYSPATLLKVDTNTWYLFGDLKA